jgi:hypothetical protein
MGLATLVGNSGYPQGLVKFNEKDGVREPPDQTFAHTSFGVVKRETLRSLHDPGQDSFYFEAELLSKPSTQGVVIGDGLMQIPLRLGVKLNPLHR